MSTKFDVKAFQDRIKQKPNDQRSEDVEYIGSNGNFFRDFSISDAIIQNETEKNGFFIFYREFYKNGNLKREGKFLKLGGGRAQIGEWKSYNEQGKVVKIHDHEKNYKISFEDVLEICKKKGIDLTDRLSSVSRALPGQDPKWIVSWSSGKEAGFINHSPVVSGPTTLIKNISIDGVTGAITEMKDSTFLDN